MPRKNLIAGNWKMNNTIPEAVVLAQEISNRMERDWLELVDVAVCPPFVDLKPVKSVFEFDRVDIAVGAQNVYWEPKGAFTGEISIAMIKNIGCAFCIVGHSERRNLFGETNEEVNLQGPRAHRGRHHPHHLRGRVCCPCATGAPTSISSRPRCARPMPAWTRPTPPVPLWPTSRCGPSARVARPRPSRPRRSAPPSAPPCRTCSALRWPRTCACSYGGSMNEGNAALLLAEPDIDGGLIGGAALKADSFIQIVKEAC